MMPDAKRLLATPEFHFQSFEGEEALFVPMDRAAYHRSAFLDRRVEALPGSPTRAPLAPLIEATQDAPPLPVGWIFHVAHCGSTLLSRLLDGVESNLVLREPPPLRQLGLAAAAGDRSDAWRGRLALARAMVARRYDRGLPTIIKANVPVNFMLDRLNAADADSPAILLHFPLGSYLLAVLRTPQHRAWVERISTNLGPALPKFSPGAAVAERAAALWLAQMLAFQALQAANPHSYSLDASQLLERPVEVATAAAKRLGVTGADIEANAAALTGSYAKDLSQPFDPVGRQRLANEDRARLSGEITIARRWIGPAADSVGLVARLDRPLTGLAATLLD